MQEFELHVSTPLRLEPKGAAVYVTIVDFLERSIQGIICLASNSSLENLKTAANIFRMSFKLQTVGETSYRTLQRSKLPTRPHSQGERSHQSFLKSAAIAEDRLDCSTRMQTHRTSILNFS